MDGGLGGSGWGAGGGGGAKDIGGIVYWEGQVKGESWVNLIANSKGTAMKHKQRSTNRETVASKPARRSMIFDF